MIYNINTTPYMLRHKKRIDYILDTLNKILDIFNSYSGTINSLKNWVDDTSTAIESNIADAIDNYNWDTVPIILEVKDNYTILDSTINQFKIDVENALSEKITIPNSANENNIAVFDANKQLKDSNVSFADVVQAISKTNNIRTQAHSEDLVLAAITDKGSLVNTLYSVNNTLVNSNTAIPTSYACKEYIDSRYSNFDIHFTFDALENFSYKMGDLQNFIQSPYTLENVWYPITVIMYDNSKEYLLPPIYAKGKYTKSDNLYILNFTIGLKYYEIMITTGFEGKLFYGSSIPDMIEATADYY